MSFARALFYGTVIVGLLDGADALVFFGLRGAHPIRIFQGIASGLLGRQAFAGGLATAALGLALHFFIAFAITAVFLLASRRMPALLRAPVLSGFLYGLGVFFVMNYIVVPLSAVRPAAFSWPVFLNGVLIHMLGVGLPVSFVARAAAGDAQPAKEKQTDSPPAYTTTRRHDEHDVSDQDY